MNEVSGCYDSIWQKLWGFPLIGTFDGNRILMGANLLSYFVGLEV
jgi:hypothetical protein